MKILSIKESNFNSDTIEHEREIDKLKYIALWLQEDEIKIIES